MYIQGFLIAIPSFIVNDLKIAYLNRNETLYTSCEELWFSESHKYAYSILTILFQYVLPLIIVTLTNLKICHYLYFKVPSLYSSAYKKRKSCEQVNVKFKQETDKKMKNENLNTNEIIHKYNTDTITTPGDEQNVFNENLLLTHAAGPLGDSRRNSDLDSTTKITFLKSNKIQELYFLKLIQNIFHYFNSQTN